MWAKKEASFKERKGYEKIFGAVPLFPGGPENSSLNLSQL